MQTIDEATIDEFIAAHPHWKADRNKDALTAEFKLPGFAAAMGFMMEIAVHADKMKGLLLAEESRSCPLLARRSFHVCGALVLRTCADRGA